MADGTARSIAEAVADGEAVDWPAARQHVSPDSAALIDALEQLARVGQVGTANRQSAYLPERLLPTPVRLIVTLAVLQILIGALGFLLQLIVQPAPQDLPKVAAVLAFAGAGYVLLSSGTERRAAWLGAFFVLVAAAFALPGVWHLARMAGLSPRDTALARGLVAESFLPATVWQFARTFPLTLRMTALDRLASAAARACWIVGGFLMAGNYLIVLGWMDPAGVLWLDRINYRGGAGFWTIVMLLMLPALLAIAIRTREAPRMERRRVGLFLCGLVGGVLPMLLEVVLEHASPAFSYWVNQQPGVHPLVATAVFVPLLAIPFATGYAVMVKRVMDVRTILRAGARYLLARNTLTVVTILPIVALAVYLFQNRSESLASLFSGAGLPLTFLAGSGAVALAMRVPLARRVDRWFGRDVEEPALILARAAERLRLSRTPRELAKVVEDAVASALHAQATVFILDERSEWFRPAVATGLSLRRQSALTALAETQPVVDVSVNGDTYRLLPADERRWIVSHEVACIVPVRQAADARLLTALIVCGDRGDALRFSTEDHRFLAALAGSVSMSLDNVHLRARQDTSSTELAVQCPACRVVVEERNPGDPCDCGSALESAALTTSVLDKYRVDRLIGAGGMGVVYHATDLLLGRDVAIKTLPRLRDDDVVRLRAEARTMASLDHPNLATIYGIEMWRGTPLLVVEYLAGGSLAQRIARGPLPLCDALEIGLRILDALAYMHRNSVLHRDLKPGNVGFTSSGQPRLLDFGLATLLQRDGIAASVAPAGTLLYMPPEALKGEPPDEMFDLWAFSVSLFQMVTGTHPLRDGRERIGDAPEPLRAFFRNALAPERAQRFPTADAVSEDLRKIRSFSITQED